MTFAQSLATKRRIPVSKTETGEHVTSITPCHNLGGRVLATWLPCGLLWRRRLTPFHVASPCPYASERLLDVRSVEAFAEVVADGEGLPIGFAATLWLASGSVKLSADVERLDFSVGIGHRAHALQQLFEALLGVLPVLEADRHERANAQGIDEVEVVLN